MSLLILGLSITAFAAAFGALCQVDGWIRRWRVTRRRRARAGWIR